MQLFIRKNILLFFLIIAACDSLVVALNLETLHFILKPLLVPTLIVAVLLSTNLSFGRNILVTGLFFSFIGDIFLLIDDQYPFLFIIGLICFLLTHLCYCWYFLQIKQSSTSLLKRNPFLALIPLAYTTGLLLILMPTLGSLKIPVIIYAVVLGCMLLCSLFAFKSVFPEAAILFTAGAIFFVLSDSLLAINKFYKSFNSAGFLIISTYCAAQFLIVKGFIKNSHSSQS